MTDPGLLSNAVRNLSLVLDLFLVPQWWQFDSSSNKPTFYLPSFLIRKRIHFSPQLQKKFQSWWMLDWLKSGAIPQPVSLIREITWPNWPGMEPGVGQLVSKKGNTCAVNKNSNCQPPQLFLGCVTSNKGLTVSELWFLHLLKWDEQWYLILLGLMR